MSRARYSDFLDAQTRTATSSYNQFNTAAGLADSINNMFGDPRPRPVGDTAEFQPVHPDVGEFADANAPRARRCSIRRRR